MLIQPLICTEECAQFDSGNNCLNRWGRPCSFGTGWSSGCAECQLETESGSQARCIYLASFPLLSEMHLMHLFVWVCLGVCIVCRLFMETREGIGLLWHNPKLTPLYLHLTWVYCMFAWGVSIPVFCVRACVCTCTCTCTCMWDLKQPPVWECLQAACWSFGVLAAADRSECLCAFGNIHHKLQPLLCLLSLSLSIHLNLSLSLSFSPIVP